MMTAQLAEPQGGGAPLRSKSKGNGGNGGGGSSSNGGTVTGGGGSGKSGGKSGGRDKNGGSSTSQRAVGMAQAVAELGRRLASTEFAERQRELARSSPPSQAALDTLRLAQS